MAEWFAKIEKICQDVSRREGCFLYEVDLVGAGQHRALRVFIDKEGGGAGIEDCSRVAQGLNEFLDTEDIIPGGAYTLEVSTPGIERVLTKPWHFEKAVGQKIWIKTKSVFEEFGVSLESVKKAKQVEAKLKEFKNDTLTLEDKKGDYQIPFGGIEKAKVVFEVAKKLKP